MAPPSILNTAKDLDRLRQISGVLTRYGFGEVLRKMGLGSVLPASKEEHRGSFAARVRGVLQELGPSFIKLGQIASTRPDIVPAELVSELKKLQAEVPPEPFETIAAVIREELGGDPDEIFLEFEEECIASASIGQVHRARVCVDGEERWVAVKVQRPKVAQLVERDIDLLYWFARLLERSVSETKLWGPVRMVGEFDRALSAELDFRIEADNAQRFQRNFDGNPRVAFPSVYPALSSRRVITQEFFHGRHLNLAVEDGFSGKQLAEQAVEIIVQSIFEDGFFHADPHPGNVIILGETEEPIFGLIDLGLVGTLSPHLRDRVVDMMVAASREDYRGVADALWAIGKRTRKVDRREFEDEVTRLAKKYLNRSLGEIELSGLIRDLGGAAQRFGMQIPTGFVMMGKSLMTIEGIGKEIYPELDIMESVKPYFSRIMAERYAPEKLANDALRTMSRFSTLANELPFQTEELLDDLRNGSFQLRVREERLHDVFDVASRRIQNGIVLGASILSAAVFAQAGLRTAAWVTLGGASVYCIWHWSAIWWASRRARK